MSSLPKSQLIIDSLSDQTDQTDRLHSPKREILSSGEVVGQMRLNISLEILSQFCQHSQQLEDYLTDLMRCCPEKLWRMIEADPVFFAKEVVMNGLFKAITCVPAGDFIYYLLKINDERVREIGRKIYERIDHYENSNHAQKNYQVSQCIQGTFVMFMNKRIRLLGNGLEERLITEASRIDAKGTIGLFDVQEKLIGVFNPFWLDQEETVVPMEKFCYEDYFSFADEDLEETPNFKILNQPVEDLGGRQARIKRQEELFDTYYKKVRQRILEYTGENISNLPLKEQIWLVLLYVKIKSWKSQGEEFFTCLIEYIQVTGLEGIKILSLTHKDADAYKFIFYIFKQLREEEKELSDLKSQKMILAKLFFAELAEIFDCLPNYLIQVTHQYNKSSINLSISVLRNMVFGALKFFLQQICAVFKLERRFDGSQLGEEQLMPQDEKKNEKIGKVLESVFQEITRFKQELILKLEKGENLAEFISGLPNLEVLPETASIFEKTIKQIGLNSQSSEAQMFADQDFRQFTTFLMEKQIPFYHLDPRLKANIYQIFARNRQKKSAAIWLKIERQYGAEIEKVLQEKPEDLVGEILSKIKLLNQLEQSHFGELAYMVDISEGKEGQKRLEKNVDLETRLRENYKFTGGVAKMVGFYFAGAALGLNDQQSRLRAHDFLKRLERKDLGCARFGAILEEAMDAICDHFQTDNQMYPIENIQLSKSGAQSFQNFCLGYLVKNHHKGYMAFSPNEYFNMRDYAKEVSNLEVVEAVPPSYTATEYHQNEKGQEHFKKDLNQYFCQNSQIQYYVLSDLNRYGGDEGAVLVREVLDELAREGRQVYLILDCCQSFGRKATNLSQIKADAVIFSTQKMMELPGIGGVMVADNYLLSMLKNSILTGLPDEDKIDYFLKEKIGKICEKVLIYRKKIRTDNQIRAWKEQGKYQEIKNRILMDLTKLIEQNAPEILALKDKILKVLEKEVREGRVFLDVFHAGGMVLEEYIELSEKCSRDVFEVQSMMHHYTELLTQRFERYAKQITIFSPPRGQETKNGIVEVGIKGLTRTEIVAYLASYGLDCGEHWCLCEKERLRESVRFSLHAHHQEWQVILLANLIIHLAVNPEEREKAKKLAEKPQKTHPENDSGSTGGGEIVDFYQKVMGKK